MRWAGADSNHRRRSQLIYSQPRLATSLPAHVRLRSAETSASPLERLEPLFPRDWSLRGESNPRPTTYKAVALPAELLRQRNLLAV